MAGGMHDGGGKGRCMAGEDTCVQERQPLKRAVLIPLECIRVLIAIILVTITREFITFSCHIEMSLSFR